MTNLTLACPVGLSVLEARTGNFYTPTGQTTTTGGTISVPAGSPDLLDALQAGCDLIGFPNSGTIFGGGSGVLAEEGNIFRQVNLSSSAAANPSSTNSDYVIAVYSLPGGSFDQSGRGLNITASGLFAANTHNKEVKIIYNPTTAVVGGIVSGGTVVADTGLQSASGTGWAIAAQVFKVGALNSNTQYAQEVEVIIGGTHGGMGIPLFPTATEASSILIAVTANCSTSGAAATDIAVNFVEVNAMN